MTFNFTLDEIEFLERKINKNNASIKKSFLIAIQQKRYTENKKSIQKLFRDSIYENNFLEEEWKTFKKETLDEIRRLNINLNEFLKNSNLYQESAQPQWIKDMNIWNSFNNSAKALQDNLSQINDYVKIIKEFLERL